MRWLVVFVALSVAACGSDRDRPSVNQMTPDVLDSGPRCSCDLDLNHNDECSNALATCVDSACCPNWNAVATCYEQEGECKASNAIESADCIEQCDTAEAEYWRCLASMVTSVADCKADAYRDGDSSRATNECRLMGDQLEVDCQQLRN